MRIKAYGKLNLTLSITGTKSGMHLIDTVMASVSLFDLLEIFESDKITVACTSSIPGVNIAQRAAEAVREICGRSLSISIQKGIPMGGGMGGSSADGAAVLYAADQLFGLSGLADLNALALSLGADVPYMLRGGFARCTGFGEIIQPLDFEDMRYVVAECGSVSTAQCYALADSLPIDDSLSNALMPAAMQLNSKIAVAADIIRSAGGQPRLTGSGGCVFTEYSSKVKAALDSNGFTVYDVVTVPNGLQTIS